MKLKEREKILGSSWPMTIVLIYLNYWISFVGMQNSVWSKINSSKVQYCYTVMLLLRTWVGQFCTVPWLIDTHSHSHSILVGTKTDRHIQLQQLQISADLSDPLRWAWWSCNGQGKPRLPDIELWWCDFVVIHSTPLKQPAITRH